MIEAALKICNTLPPSKIHYNANALASLIPDLEDELL